jgi:predicted ATPase/class 3 adenylate cyclase
MDFYEVADQIVKLLQQRGRLTYRSLKVQFKLDDETLEALKEEILYSQPQVIDDEGRGLIWTGEAETQSAATSTQSAKPEAVPEAQPTQSEPPPEPPTPEAERRQLTVMFCDLVGSTPLSEQLDPEDLRDVVRAYQQTCAEVVQRFDGHIAQLLGDALLVYFGWPQAHEDDAQRAVRTGLGMLDAMGALNAHLEADKGIRLSIRVGIHTGLVVVGKMGGGGHQEQLALGETPNVASRLQGLAEPDTVAISEATFRLVEGYFTCQGLGEQRLKGVGQAMPVYRVLGESGAQSRLDIATTRGLTPLVGRESEVTLLLERWEQVQDGQGQVVLLSGEAGIGKSRLVQVLKDHVAEEPHTRLECRSSPYYQNTALYPITALLQRTFQWQPDESPEAKLRKLEQTLGQFRLPLEETVPLFATLLSLPLSESRYVPLPWTPQRQRQKTLESIVAMVLEQAERRPVLFILEDLHWTDPSTLELLDLLIEQTPTVALLVIFTCRPEFEPPWGLRTHLTSIALNRFTRSQIDTMIAHVTNGKILPAEVTQHLAEKTDGVPLYVEEMTRAILEAGVLQESDGHYVLTGPVTSLAIPTTLQDSLMARLDRLETAKGVAQWGATLGRQFSYSLLQAVSQLDAMTLQHELERLVEAELLYQRGVSPQATYIFKHALIQDAAYQSLLRRTRQDYHQRIAQVMVEQFPEMVETQPELLAYHYTEAGRDEAAVSCWQRAGQYALQRSAYVEAIAHLTQGLALLMRLPETPARLQQELDLQVALGPPLVATKGYAAPDVERAYARAQELCQQLGDIPQLFPVLRGLMMYYLNRGDLQTTNQLGEQLLRLAQVDSALLLLAHHQLGMVLLMRGEPASAHAHHMQALAIYTPQEHRVLALRYGIDLGVASHSFLAWELWQLGYPDQALQHSQTARALAQEVSHPYSLAQALLSSAMVHQHRRETLAAHEQAAAATTLATEQGFAQWVAYGTVLHGGALAMQGQGEQGIAKMRQGLATVLTTEKKVFQPYFLGLLAEAYGAGGCPDEGLHALAEAVAIMDDTEVRFYGAELYRLKGVLLLRQVIPDASQAEACFHQALNVARQQQAKSWELRAATSLARLWQSQDKRQDAYDLLAPVYEWFTEGFDTADLKDAKVVLDELEDGR